MRLRLEFSLSALLVIILLLHSTNGVEITEQDATVGSVPESTGPVPSPEQRTTTESSPENSLPNSRWYRRLGEIVKRLQGYKNYLFARNDNERSRVEQAAVDAVQPTFEMVEAGMSNPLVAELIQKSSGLSLPQPIVRFLTLIREKWLTIMMVSSFSSGFYNIYFAIYMTYMMFATFFKTLWAFKGTLALTAFTVPTVTYAIDQIKTFKAGTSSPTPDDDAAKTDPDQLEKNAAQTFNVAESLSDDHYFQQDQPGSGDSSTSWIWMVVLAFVGLLFVTATGYFVYKKMNRRRSEDVMEV